MRPQSFASFAPVPYPIVTNPVGHVLHANVSPWDTMPPVAQPFVPTFVHAARAVATHCPAPHVVLHEDSYACAAAVEPLLVYPFAVAHAVHVAAALLEYVLVAQTKMSCAVVSLNVNVPPGQ